jgi:hypothetical protein
MAQAVVIFTDVDEDGVKKVRFDQKVMELSAEEAKGDVSPALLSALWVSQQFAAGKIDINDAFKKVKGQYEVKKAVERAVAGS